MSSRKRLDRGGRSGLLLYMVKCMQKNDKSLVVYARLLRKNMTVEELRLWRFCLKGLPVVIKRQKQIGEYIVDFYCPKAKLVIEIDGARHFMPEGKIADKKRDEFLRSKGITVMRFSNNEVNNDFEKVCWSIINYISSVTGVVFG